MRTNTLLASVATIGVATGLTTGANAADKVVLFQEFTATWCGYCPAVAAGLHMVLEANPETTTGLMVHGGDAYTTSLGNQLINFYNLSGYPTVWVDGTQSQAGSYGSAQANANNLTNLMNQAQSSSDVTIDVVGTESGNNYTLDIDVSLDNGGATRNMRIYVTQVYNQQDWPESNEIQFNTLRQSAPTVDVTLSAGQSHSISHTFTLSGESLNTQHVNYVIWAQQNSGSAPAQVFNAVEHKHGEMPPADVSVGPGGDYTTIQAALDAVGSGSTVTVAPGVYHETIDFNGRSIDLVATAGDPSTTVIDPQGQGRGVIMLGGSNGSIEGFTIRNAYVAGSGSALVADGAPEIVNCIVRDNVADQNYVIVSAGNIGIRDTIVCSNSPNNQVGGWWTNQGGNTFDPSCGDEPCEGDFDGDGTIGVDDILAVLGGFGSQYTVDDILSVLAAFGDSC